ncbi:FAD-dependent monooxygenase [Mycolicibacterium mengxianglii]|uniref:FAD-dependent monooxygenase n=1 Tax=Mycolicibacterium mengxianglii TaxID=2736649 RepID=UPI0018EF002D|nr:FAD-dependent monooxygenase [Mycolicibacterium mengxianglii]
MRIVCVGGGPAGLYFAILTKLADPDHEVTVFERNPSGVTYGWGVTISDELLDDLFRCDPVSARDIWNSAAKWDEYEVRAGGKPTMFLGGYWFGLSRRQLLSILTVRATQLGVDVRTLEVEDLSTFDDADLVVACDGANSRIRQLHADTFATNVDVGRNKYIWLGTRAVFETFTWAFEETEAGWIWFHGYPFTADTSTVIVECMPETWSALGFDVLSSDDTRAALEKIFARHLDGNPLIDQLDGLGRAPWSSFRRVTNERWHNGRVVLMGDAAHTTHFGIGSGTKLAMQDAMALAARLTPGANLEAALDAYERQRRADIAPPQQAALSSSRWFEDLDRHVDQDGVRFAYSLLSRLGEYPRWRYWIVVATQREPLRQLQRGILSVRRWARARRRSARLPGGLGVEDGVVRPAPAPR